MRWLVALLRIPVDALRNDVRRRWNRDLPISDLVDDRWIRAKRLGFGAGSSIYGSAVVYGAPTVGENVWVGPMALIDASADAVAIGSGTTVAAMAQIYTHSTVRRVISGGALPIDHAPVSIGVRVYIAPAVFVAMGVSIGDGAVIGAGSFVNSDIPAGMFAAGSPARVIGPADRFLANDTSPG